MECGGFCLVWVCFSGQHHVRDRGIHFQVRSKKGLRAHRSRMASTCSLITEFSGGAEARFSVLRASP